MPSQQSLDSWYSSSGTSRRCSPAVRPAIHSRGLLPYRRPAVREEVASSCNLVFTSQMGFVAVAVAVALAVARDEIWSNQKTEGQTARQTFLTSKSFHVPT